MKKEALQQDAEAIMREQADGHSSYMLYRAGFIAGYIAHAEKEEQRAIEFARWIA